MSFANLNLSQPLISALNEMGYEKPSPIQAQTIPLLLEGKNVLGQAQTGTGKTAAFALPTLCNIDTRQKHTQVLVLTPTRELAIQVSDAFQRYGANLKNLNVLPIYGGQDYRVQLRALDKGIQIVVGTPGRIMDHMRRKTLVLTQLNTLVLDEADEMLRMGFIEDVEWILEHTPSTCQMALFSATMPKEIRHIAERFLKSPEKVTIKEKTATVATISQRYLMTKGSLKLDALTRILEAETFDGVLVFVRTKNATLEVAEALNMRGYASAALNGDILQTNRERIIEQLKKGKLDIVVATDVAARGLDVDRISHVINYDISQDNETYIHRIGRTGRAGRSGQAILFISPREKGLLYSLEKTTKQPITEMELPSTELINKKRIEHFKQEITNTLQEQNLDIFANIIAEYQTEHEVQEKDLCAALVKLFHKQSPLFIKQNTSSRKESRDKSQSKERFTGEMQRFRIEVGHKDKVRPGNIVGAIANEISLDSQEIGNIDIYDGYTIVDLPKTLSKESLRILEKVWVSGKQLQIRTATEEDFQDREQRRDRPRSQRNESDRRPRSDARRSERSSARRTDGRTESRGSQRTDGRTESRSDRRTDARTESRSDRRTDARAENRGDRRTDARTEKSQRGERTERAERGERSYAKSQSTRERDNDKKKTYAPKDKKRKRQLAFAD